MATLQSRGEGAATARSDSAWLRYAATEGRYTYVPAGVPAEQGLPISIGALFILDYRRLLEGEVSFKPKFDDSLMVPRGQPLPPRCGKEGYADGLQLDVIVQGFGIATFTSTAESVCRVLERFYTTYCFAPESQGDQVQVVRIDVPREYQTKHGSTLYDPKWTLCGWVPRVGHFRPPLLLVPPPVQFAPKVIAEDAAFAGITNTGEVVTPATAPAAPAATRRKGKPAQITHVPLPGAPGRTARDDLNDEIPF
jgi:hypothetical protein